MNKPANNANRESAIILMLACGIVCLLAGSGFVISDIFRHGQAARQEIRTTGSVLATAAAPAMLAGDSAGARQALQALGTNRRVVSAAFYQNHEVKPLAAYFRPGVRETLVPPSTGNGIYEADESLVLVQDVVLEGQLVGILTIRSDASDLATVLERDLSVACFLLLTCALMSLLLIARVRQKLTPNVPSPGEVAVISAGIPAHSLGQVPAGSTSAKVSVTSNELSESKPLAAASSSLGAADPIEKYNDASPEVHLQEMASLRAQAEQLEGDVVSYRARLQEETTRHAAAEEQSQAELAAAVELAGQTARSRAEFLAGMTQVLRDRINSFVGTAYLGMNRNMTPAQHEALTAASNSAEVMMKTLDDMVDFLRLESGAATLDPQEFGIAETLYDVTRMFANSAQGKGVEILLEVHPELPAGVVGDRSRLRQILETLVSNAVRFTDAGRIVVEATPLFRSERTVGVHFAVRDTGPGMGPQEFRNALEPFDVPPDFHSRPARSSGLSLAIANRIVSMMGGNLWLESEPGRGSTLHFTATFEIAGPAPAIPPSVASLAGARVLIADGNPLIRRTLHQLLARWQMKPAVASSSPEALDLLRSAASTLHPFDLVLADSEMAGSGSRDLADEIRLRPEFGSPAIISLVDVHSGPVTDLARRFRHSGYVVKPVAHPVLLRTLTDAMQAHRR